MTRTRSSRPRPIAWRPVALGVALATACALVGSTAHAAWTTAVTATGSVSAGRLELSASGTMESVMRNSDSHTTRSVTFTNDTLGSSTQRASTSVVVKATGGDPVIAAQSIVWVWPSSDPALCTAAADPGPGMRLGTWANGVTVTGTLARGESQTYCVRTMPNKAVESSTGSRSMTATATATMTLGSFQTVAESSAQISTKAIYPFAVPQNAWYRAKPSGQNLCLDVEGGANATSGSSLSTYACHAGNSAMYANQWLSVEEHAGFVTLNVGMPTGTSLRAEGSSVTVAPTDPQTSSQQWLTQRVTADTYQLVSASTGLCLTAPSTAGRVTMAVCDDLGTQKFVLVSVATPAPVTLAADLPTGNDAPGVETPVEEPTALDQGDGTGPGDAVQDADVQEDGAPQSPGDPDPVHGDEPSAPTTTGGPDHD